MTNNRQSRNNWLPSRAALDLPELRGATIVVTFFAASDEFHPIKWTVSGRDSRPNLNW